MRTYSRSDWLAAQAAWADGRFSPEWADVRHQAAMRGMIWPPSGTRWDSWEDGRPSQRAIVVRAIRNHPALLADCVAQSSTWSQVVGRLMRRMAEWREEVAAAAAGGPAVTPRAPARRAGETAHDYIERLTARPDFARLCGSCAVQDALREAQREAAEARRRAARA